MSKECESILFYVSRICAPVIWHFQAKRTDEKTLPHTKTFTAFSHFGPINCWLFFCRGEKCGVPCSMFTEPLTEYHTHSHSVIHNENIYQRRIYIHFVIVKRRIAERKSWCKWVIRASCDTVVKNHEKEKTNGLANIHMKEKTKILKETKVKIFGAQYN